MSRRPSLIPADCEECPLPDCYPTDPRCPVLRKKAEKKGVTLRDVPADAPVRTRQPNQKRGDIVPVQYEDRADYQRQYNKEYNLRFRRVMIRGVYLQRKDIELLRSVCEAEGKTLEGEITMLLELMVQKARGGAA